MFHRSFVVAQLTAEKSWNLSVKLIHSFHIIMFLFYFQNLVKSEDSTWKQCFELSGMNVEHIGQVTVFLSLFDISREPLLKGKIHSSWPSPD